MKKFIVCLSILTSFIGTSQIANQDEAQEFWNTNVRSLVNNDVKKILEETNFPIQIKPTNTYWSEAEFKEKLPQLLSEDMRMALGKMSYKNIDAWANTEEATRTYMVACHVPYEDYDAAVFVFMQIDNQWKLIGIDFQEDL